jgi:hypothetical protein
VAARYRLAPCEFPERSSATPRINSTKLKAFPVLIPPTLDEQREIVAILDAIDHKANLHKRKRAVLEDLFNAVLHKLISGEIRVADLDLSALKESIEDETTLPIKHVLAPSEITVPAERLDKEFFELATAEGITDIEELNRVLDRAVGLRTFLKSDERVTKVAAFIAEHFKENVKPLGYKAFVVAVDREACAKYKQALDKLLPPEWSVPVYTENAADIVDRPIVAGLQISPEREDDVRTLFKKPAEDPKILIVTDKLLTGFDAPVLYCLYLDKPMRDHVLLQAIARVNRPYVDAEGVQKRVGLVVDFVGVLRELKKALQFDSADVSGVIEDLDVLLNDLKEKIVKAQKDYLDAGEGGGADERLERVVYGRFLDPEPRKAFFEAYKEIENLWEILSPSAELRDHIIAYTRTPKGSPHSCGRCDRGDSLRLALSDETFTGQSQIATATRRAVGHPAQGQSACRAHPKDDTEMGLMLHGAHNYAC